MTLPESKKALDTLDEVAALIAADEDLDLDVVADSASESDADAVDLPPIASSAHTVCFLLQRITVDFP